jgi:ABC-2 type transport system permease protein
MMSLPQAAFVIGRRDFTATVYSRTFLLFLLGPLFIIGISFCSAPPAPAWRGRI